MTTELTLPAPVAVHDRLGQGTAIEMSRAVAEVHAAMYAARQFPRDERAATAAMENSCRQLFVAERAFFRLPRAGDLVTGPTVHLARELARCWGHIQHGISEMRRDDEHGQSEMLAFAWDVQTGTRVHHTFIVPHKRDKKRNGKTTPEPLISLQEVYENNANNGARRVRECIFGVLPPWFTERAKELCYETKEKGDGTPLAQRIDNAVARFKEIGVSLDQLEGRLELQRLRWTGHEVSLLGTIYSSIKRGEIRVDDEFPPKRINPEEIRANAAAALPEPASTPDAPTPHIDEPPAEIPSTEPPVDEPPADRAPKALVDKLKRELRDLGIATTHEQRHVAGRLAKRLVRDLADLTTQEGAQIADDLAAVRGSQEPARALDQLLVERDEERSPHG